MTDFKMGLLSLVSPASLETV